MENIVNLEQLSYRDQMIKEYIDSSSGGTGSGMVWGLEVHSDINTTPRAHMYIKCKKGAILESDTLQTARNSSTVVKWGRSGGQKYVFKRRRGWIIPHPYNRINLYKVYSSSLSDSNWDFWEILPKDRNDQNITWQQLLNAFLEHRFNCVPDPYEDNLPSAHLDGTYNYNYACFVNRWVGVAVIRDGKNISGYKEWMIAGPPKIGCPAGGNHFISRYSELGTYASNDAEEDYIYGLRVKK